MNEKEQMTTEQMIRAAAMALMLNQECGIEISGVDTGKFVQTTRSIWKQNGYSFTDSDIRAIHQELRALVVAELQRRQKAMAASQVQ